MGTAALCFKSGLSAVILVLFPQLSPQNAGNFHGSDKIFISFWNVPVSILQPLPPGISRMPSRRPSQSRNSDLSTYQNCLESIGRRIDIKSHEVTCSFLKFEISFVLSLRDVHCRNFKICENRITVVFSWFTEFLLKIRIIISFIVMQNHNFTIHLEILIPSESHLTLGGRLVYYMEGITF